MKYKHILAGLIAAFTVLLWPSDASAACLSRAYDDVAQVPLEQRGQTHQVLVADEDIAALESKGFRRATCSAELTDQRVQLEYRNGLCEFVAGANELVERQAEQALGAPPGLLCASAEKLVGRWNGEPGPTQPQPPQASRIIDGEGISIPVDPDSAGEAK